MSKAEQKKIQFKKETPTPFWISEARTILEDNQQVVDGIWFAKRGLEKINVSNMLYPIPEDLENELKDLLDKLDLVEGRFRIMLDKMIKVKKEANAI